jgi:hypothetical protein
MSPLVQTPSCGRGRVRPCDSEDVEASAGFNETVFGWGTRENRDGEGEAVAAFRDPAGNVLGIVHQ